MVRFWRREMENGEIWGRHPLDIHKNRKNQGKIHRISTIRIKCIKSLQFHVVPFEICWMTNRWFYQHGSFVVSCREPLGNFPAETSPQFLPQFRIEMRGKFPQMMPNIRPMMILMDRGGEGGFYISLVYSEVSKL